MKDGDVDYSNYSLRDLFQALDVIDRARYPQNYENLQKALLRTRIGAPSPKVQKDAGTTFPELAAGFAISALLWIGVKILIAAAPQLAVHFAQGWKGAGLSPGPSCESCNTGQE